MYHDKHNLHFCRRPTYNLLQDPSKPPPPDPRSGKQPRGMCWLASSPIEMWAIMQHLELLVNADHILETQEGHQAAEKDETAYSRKTDARLWLY